MPKIMITGATGYVGSMLIRQLLQENKDMEMVAPVRNLEKAEKMLQEKWGKSGKVRLFQLDLADRKAVKGAASACGDMEYLIHCASVTKSSEMISHPVETIESIINITQNVLELARQCPLKSMVYLSSMEIYGAISPEMEAAWSGAEQHSPEAAVLAGKHSKIAVDMESGSETERASAGHRVSEEELGKIKLHQVRSCYPLGKRMAENICYSYYKEYGVPVKIARLAQTFGAGILSGESRVFAQFAKAAKRGEDIVLHTAGDSMGNYCGIHDAVRGIMTILKKGVDGEAYNVVNEENTMTIRQMAEFVAEKVAGGEIKVVYDIPQDNRYGYAAQTGLRLSGKKLEGLGWRAEEDMAEMYRQAVEALR